MAQYIYLDPKIGSLNFDPGSGLYFPSKITRHLMYMKKTYISIINSWNPIQDHLLLDVPKISVYMIPKDHDPFTGPSSQKWSRFRLSFWTWTGISIAFRYSGPMLIIGNSIYDNFQQLSYFLRLDRCRLVSSSCILSLHNHQLLFLNHVTTMTIIFGWICKKMSIIVFSLFLPSSQIFL